MRCQDFICFELLISNDLISARVIWYNLNKHFEFCLCGKCTCDHLFYIQNREIPKVGLFRTNETKSMKEQNRTKVGNLQAAKNLTT